MAWSDLPLDLLHRIASQLPVVDFLRFLIACTLWNSAPTKNSLLQIRCLPSPWLLLPSIAGEASDTLTFRDLTGEEDNVVCHRHFSSLGGRIFGRRCIGSMDGWLVTLDNVDLQPLLFNPLTKAERSLPSLFTIPENYWHWITMCHDDDDSNTVFSNEFISYNGVERERLREEHFHKIVVSSNDPLGTAAVIYGTHVKMLAFARPGEQAWALAPPTPPHRFYHAYDIEDVCYHEKDQKFYAITYSSAVLAFDLNGQNIILICPEKQDCGYRDLGTKFYITFWSGTLLRIERKIEFVETEIYEYYTGKTIRISVSKLISPVVDPTCSFSEWSSVKDLGGLSIFIGCNHTFFLQPMVAPGIKPNCIYFSDDWEYLSAKDFDRDAGLFDLHSDSFQYFLDSNSQPKWPTSIWFTPSLL